jgi:hypothetical protein
MENHIDPILIKEFCALVKCDEETATRFLEDANGNL